MPFSFNAVELCVVTINEKPWTRTKEVCRALEYNKKTADIVKAFSSQEYYVQKYQMSDFKTAGKPVDWPKDSQKYDNYTNEEGVYELLFSSQQPKAKDFRRHCCNCCLLMFVSGLQTDAALALLNDDLQDHDNQIQVLQYENVAFQAQKDVYQAELQKCQDTITHHVMFLVQEILVKTTSS